MIKFTKLIALILLIVISVTSFTACSSSEKTNENEGYTAKTLRVCYSASYASIIQQTMREKAILEKYVPDDVSIEWVNINAGSDMRDALVAGQVDIAAMSASIAITALENGLPLSIYSCGPIMPTRIYSNSPEIQSLDDINADTRISIISLGSVYQMALGMYTKEYYGDSTRFNENLTAMDNVDALLTLKSGNGLDCSILFFPFSNRADRENNLTEIFDLTPIMIENSLGPYFVASNSFINENPVLAEALYSAMQETVEYINSNPDEIGELLSDFYGADASDISETIIEFPINLDISEKAYNKLSSFLYETGVISAEPKKFAELPNYDNIPKSD